MYKIKSIFIISFFLIIGLLITFYPTLFSNFKNVQTELGDTRFNIYRLEHSYLWIKAAPLHKFLWDLPIFYPYKKTLAYSDTMLGAAFPYWLIRMLFLPDTAYQIWLIVISILNYSAMFLFLNKGLKYSTFPSSIGSFIFSFSIPRTIQLAHAQLLPGFFIIFSLFGLYKFFTGKSKYAFLNIFFFYAGIVLQLITTYYLAFFYILSLFLTLLLSLTHPRNIIIIFEKIKTQILPLITLTLLSAFVILLMYQNYISLGKKNGLWNLEEIKSYIPTFMAWFYSGSNSLIYSKISDVFHFRNPEELKLSVGYFTSAIIVYSAIINRRKPFYKLLIYTSILLITITTVIPFTTISVWYVLADKIFFLRSVKPIGRVIFILLIPISIFVAEFFQNIKYKSILVLLSLFIIIEQIQILESFDKLNNRNSIMGIVNRIPKNCDIFYYISRNNEIDYKTQVDAMWAGIYAAKYTINGYSTWYPPYYNEILKSNAKDYKELLLVKKGFNKWIQDNKLYDKNTCLVY